MGSRAQGLVVGPANPLGRTVGRTHSKVLHNGMYLPLSHYKILPVKMAAKTASSGLLKLNEHRIFASGSLESFTISMGDQGGLICQNHRQVHPALQYPCYRATGS